MVLLLVPLLVACASPDEDTGDTGTTVGDVDPPVIEHSPVTDPQSASGNVLIEANVRDDSGVLAVTLYHRPETELEFENLGMTWVGGDAYQAVLGPGDLESAAIEYYIEAVDVVGNARRVPENAPDDVYSFPLVD